MAKKKKPRTPFFVSAKLEDDGTITMLTDEGDEFHCEMRDDGQVTDGWPLVSRLSKWRDQFDYGVKKKKVEEPPKPTRPTLIKG